MAKKLKKNKPAASNQKKPASVKASGVGTVLKKAAKTVAKKVAASLPKKVAEKAKKSAPIAAKGAVKSKPEVKSSKKEVVVSKVVVAKVSVTKVTALISAKSAKGKKEAAPAPAPEKEKAKGKKELVVELPAAKGLALLEKGNKKLAKKLANEAALNKKRCREPGCDHDCTISGYCRMHYIKNWRKIKRKEAILASGQLNNYVEELVSKYPDKYLDVIRQDLASEKDWSKVVVDLELESADEDASAEEDIDVAAEGVSRTRTEFDDDSDAF